MRFFAKTDIFLEGNYSKKLILLKKSQVFLLKNRVNVIQKLGIFFLTLEERMAKKRKKAKKAKRSAKRKR